MRGQIDFAAIGEPFRVDCFGIDFAGQQMRAINQKGVGEQQIKIDKLAGVERLVLRLLLLHALHNCRNFSQMIIIWPQRFLIGDPDRIDQRVDLRLQTAAVAPCRHVSAAFIKKRQYDGGVNQLVADGDLRRNAGRFDAVSQKFI